jgi:hypothetical protein
MNKMSPQHQLTLWVGATRYYMGRMSYAVSDFCNLLIGSWNELGENTKAIIQRDVEEEVVRDDESRKRGDSFHPLGHDCDRKSWEHVIKLWTKVTNEGDQI